MFCALSGISLSWKTLVFGRFTSQERTNVHRTAFFLHTPDFSLSKVTALKVVWGKDTSRRSKEPGSDLPSCFSSWAPFCKCGWRHHIYPDLVVARTDHYSYLLFYYINKGDLPLMYFCVFWCEFIDLVLFFYCYCLTPVTLFIIRSTCVKVAKKNSRRSIESQIFSPRGKLLSSLHCSKRLKAKYPHACCWKWKFPRAMSKIPSFTRRCDRATGHGALAPRSNFSRTRVAQSN